MEPLKDTFIYNFLDYRKYLQAYYTYMKEHTPSFSHRKFMEKTGINSPNYLKNVIDRKKNLTESSILKFATALGLTAAESDYFSSIVKFDQAGTSDEKEKYFERMKLVSKSVGKKLVDEEQSQYFSQWYHCVVRELVATRNYQDDWLKLGRDLYPNITPAQARKSVETLLKLGMIKKNSNGTYMQTSKNVTAGDTPLAVMQIRQHHKESLKNAGNAIDDFPTSIRSLTSLIMSLNDETYLQIEEEVKEFRNRLTLLANNTKNPNRVYQLAIQLFPVSKKDKGV